MSITNWQPIPTDKADSIESLLTRLYGKDRRQVILNRECMGCDTTHLQQQHFVDEQSFAEYHISGLCQTCQDHTFTE